MKLGKQIIFTISVLIPLLVLVLNIIDICNLYQHSDSYPFGSEFFASYSVYSSKNVYIIYTICLSVLLIVMILFAYKKKWLIYSILFILGAILFLYPSFTNE